MMRNPMVHSDHNGRQINESIQFGIQVLKFSVVKNAPLRFQATDGKK